MKICHKEYIVSIPILQKEAFIKLIGQQRKEIRKRKKLRTPQRPEGFVYRQNHRFDKKT
jgi:hypothetical protein